MEYTSAIFKIGGKILENLEDLNSTVSQLTQLFKNGHIKKIVLIPGGGTLANFIRQVYSELQLTEELGHWMGIISMNYNGIELGKKFPGLNVIEDINILKKLNKTLCIFLPYRFLKETDILPHSWDVTSDSISLYLAKELDLSHCFLIKDVEGIFDKDNHLIKQLTTSEYKEMKHSGKLREVKTSQGVLKNQSKPVDSYIISLIEKWKIRCVILNGKASNQRIMEYFDESKSNSEKTFSVIKY
ncbi:MAG: amino acid kinase family protein [Promethearchaeota archaeon]